MQHTSNIHTLLSPNKYEKKKFEVRCIRLGRQKIPCNALRCSFRPQKYHAMHFEYTEGKKPDESKTGASYNISFKSYATCINASYLTKHCMGTWNCLEGYIDLSNIDSTRRIILRLALEKKWLNGGLCVLHVSFDFMLTPFDPCSLGPLHRRHRGFHQSTCIDSVEGLRHTIDKVGDLRGLGIKRTVNFGRCMPKVR